MRLRTFAPTLAFSTLLFACSTLTPKDATDAEGAKQVLPLERVRLYASGVGYFERAGTVDDTSGALPVPAGHLDDALKSLVVFNDHSQLGSVSFPSRLSPAVARARAGLPANQDAVLSYDRLLVALRGQDVELRLKADERTGSELLRGRVIDVVAVQPTHPSYDHGMPHLKLEEGQQLPEEKERLQVLLLSEAGAILRLDASQLDSVRTLDDIVARRLHAALSARLATRSNQRQELALTSPTPAKIRLAYLAEAPTWRASYRLLLNDKARRRSTSRLQAWALIHNDTDEAWRHIQLELVDGRPNSFLFPMTAPRYERRGLETPERELSSVPQLSTTTPDALWGDFSDYQGEQVARIGSEGISGIGEGGGGYGAGAGLGGIGTIGHGSGKGRGRSGGSDLLWAGDLAHRAGVVATAERTSSVFRVERKLDLEPQHSAMVPFLDSPVGAQPIVWFDGFDAAAERAVGVSNNTAHTLPAGPLAVYGSGGFLGEAMLASLKPGERQFAQISDEPDAAIRADRSRAEKVLQHLAFRNNQLETHLFSTTTTRLYFDNSSGKTRQFYVALDIVRNATVRGSTSVDYDSSTGRPFAVFELGPGKAQEHTLVTTEAIREATSSGDLTREDLDDVIHTGTIPLPERDIVQRALVPYDSWQEAKRSAAELKIEANAVEADLGRLKKHLESLGKSESGGADAQLIRRILEREDELSELNKKMRALAKELERKENAFEVVLAELDQFREALLAARKQASLASHATSNGS